MVVIKRRNTIIYSMLFWLINLSYIALFLIWISVNWNSQEVFYDFNARLFPWICGLIGVQIVSFGIKKVPLYDFGLWFVALSYLFMFGYMFRDIFKLETVLIWNPIVNYDNSVLFHAYIFVILSLQLFSFGYLMFFRRLNALKKDTLWKTVPDEIMYSLGLILLLIGGIAKLINDIQIITFMQSENSYSAYSQAVGTGISNDIAFLMLPGVFFIFFSGCIKESTKKTIFVIVLAYLACTMLLTGSRKIQIFSILSLFLGYEFSFKKRRMSVGRTIIYAFLAITLLNILITIRDNRFDLAIIGSELVENIFSFNLITNLWGEILAETGLTFLSVASIIDVVPNTLPHEYGLTYFRTLPSFLPIGWFVGDFFNLASSTFVINSFTGIPVGSSFIGDLYWNWGYFGGALAAFFCGVLVCKFIYAYSKFNTRKSWAMYFSIFSLLIILVRSELIDVYRFLIMLIIVVFVFERFKIKIRKVKR